MLIAGLFRALVDHESQHAAEPALTVLPPLGRAAIWRAARSGLEGELADLAGPIKRPAATVIDTSTHTGRRASYDLGWAPACRHLNANFVESSDRIQ